MNCVLEIYYFERKVRVFGAKIPIYQEVFWLAEVLKLKF